MSNPLTRALSLALLAALPLTLAPVAGAQTEPATEAEPEAGQAPDAGGPKRLKVPQAEPSEATAEPAAGEDAAAADPGDEPAAEIELLPEADAAAADEPAEAGGAEAGAAVVQTEPEATTEEAEQADAPEASGTEVVVTDEAGTGPFVGDYTIGDPSAPVQVIEYASFTCPHCAAFHVDGWPGIEEDYVDTGRIGFTLRDVYFDRFGLWASMAARCGGEAAFYPLAEQFLRNQEDWTRAEDPAQAIAEIARRGGLTDQQLKACLENQDFAKLLMEEYQKNAIEDELDSTPTFLIRSPDGEERVVGNNPDALREAIEKALPSG